MKKLQNVTNLIILLLSRVVRLAIDIIVDSEYIYRSTFFDRVWQVRVWELCSRHINWSSKFYLWRFIQKSKVQWNTLFLLPGGWCPGVDVTLWNRIMTPDQDKVNEIAIGIYKSANRNMNEKWSVEYMVSNIKMVSTE